MTPQTVDVLRALLAKPTKPKYGRELGQELGLKSGTLHPILARLEHAGLVESFWEEPAAHEDQGRPRRRYYRFTPDGAERARLALAAVTQTAVIASTRRRLAPGH
ncbi:PadR family transcriptional regulator [Micromonospora sp. AP08]|uniref:PadR family transcriptional regulator n=1 Tax=Micromonospora sp. AP08 TaxID=2604467 RepID=UPI0011DC2FFA|nr:helix-turn-helix transcriptional regulator [Micromonospora sp. AP08]TYB36952.1 PadR family transcriptional regulator [Micromonospora sp. AP08]